MAMMRRDEPIFCWGHDSQGGTYLLRLTVRQPLMIRFGRFRAGELIAVPSGEYLYVGSALAQKGATSLARRLLRHASRSDVQNPHPIRQELLAQFMQMGLGPARLQPPTGKKLYWHADFLLDEPTVDLTAVYLIRSPQRLEEPIARWLMNLPQVSLIAPGLGGTDDPGGTHLLRVTAVPAWWYAFSAKLTTFLEGVAA